LYKELVDRPRPDATQVEVRAVHSSKSFPSGHSLSTTTVWGAAAALTWRQRRRLAAIGLAVPIVATGVASAVQGVHWPSDALAGTVVGGFAAAAIVRTLDRGQSLGAMASPGSGPSG
jgi:membrane-associated phospholipid phosphatase